MELLDTNVVSELRKVRKGRADAGVAAWADSAEEARLHISVVTLQELELGVQLAERRDEQKGVALRRWLEERVIPAFAGRIIPVDTAVARLSARLHVPDPQPFRDSLIAATALVHGLTVVTRNVADFGPMEVAVHNPWEGSDTRTSE